MNYEWIVTLNLSKGVLRSCRHAVILNLFQNPTDDVLDFLEWTIDNSNLLKYLTEIITFGFSKKQWT